MLYQDERYGNTAVKQNEPVRDRMLEYKCLSLVIIRNP
jgi:hypothetical protein